jgi:hypothetical protein
MNRTLPREGLRQKLLSIGIPADQHDHASLIRFFPPQFLMHESNLDQNALAEVLIYLAKSNVIKLPRRLSAAGGPALDQLEVGSHLCQFYQDRADCLEIAGRFLRAGLQRGEKCVWVLPQWLTPAEARASLRAPARTGGLPAEALVELMTGAEWYLSRRGTPKPWSDILAAWLEREEGALAAGFRALRLAGDTTGLPDDWDGFLEYERKIDQALSARRITALCTYPLKAGPRSRLGEAAATHDSLFAKRGRAWRTLPRAARDLSALVVEAEAGVS